MNAITIWVVAPILAAIALYSIRRWESATHFSGVAIACILAWLAWQLPIGESIPMRLWARLPALKIADSLVLFGQHLVLNDSSRPVILMIYLSAGFWFGGAYASRVHRLFIPFGLAIAALLVAALALEASIYAPLIFEMVALAAVFLLSPPGKPMNRGALRFISYQTIGMCLILLAERWLLIPMTTSDHSTEVPVAILIIGLGFALILAIFPFHTWLPMAAEETNPYTAAFVFYMLPAGISFYLFLHVDRYSILWDPTIIFAGLRTMGILMVMVGGAWTAMERNLGRMLGFTALTQIGVLVLSIGLKSETTQNPWLAGVLFAQLAPFGIGLALWAHSLCVIQFQVADLSLSSVEGLAARLPVATTSLLLAQFSLCGLPLLASFPIYTVLWSILVQHSIRDVLLLTIGNACLLVAGLRTLAAFHNQRTFQARSPDLEITEGGWQLSESRMQIVILVLGGVMLFIAGFMPQWPIH